MFTNPLFEGSKVNINESFDTYHENFTFKTAPQGELQLDQARNSINNLMLKFEKPKKNDKKSKEEDDDDFKLLTESFMINLDKLNTSHLTIKPMDLKESIIEKKQDGFFRNNPFPLPLQEVFQKNNDDIFQKKKEEFFQEKSQKEEKPQEINNVFSMNSQGIYQQNPQFSNEISYSLELKNQALESRNKALEETISKMHDDHMHFLTEIESLQRRLSEIEREKQMISQKNTEDLENIKTLTQQLRNIQEQTSDNAKEFLYKKEALTQQYDKQIQEMKETIRLNEDLLRKSITKETLYEAVQLQMEELQRSNKNLQGQLTEVLEMLEASKEKFMEKENSLINLTEKLQKENGEIREKNQFLETEIWKLKEYEENTRKTEENEEIMKKYKEISMRNEEKIRELEGFLERKEREIDRLKVFEKENEELKGFSQKISQDFQEKFYESQEILMRYKSEELALLAINKDLKRNCEIFNEDLKENQKKIEEKEEILMEKELGFKEKYGKLEELYKNSKEIIENYNVQLEDYKEEKELLIRQLLEEKSKYQQERMSFTDQKRYYEENMKKFEGGIHQKEEKIKGLMKDLLEKEGFIRMSIYDKNTEFEKIKQEFYRQIENKDKEIGFLSEKYEGILKEKELWERNSRENDGKIREIEGKMKRIIEENERIQRENQIKNDELLERKVKELHENNEILSRKLMNSEQIFKEKELWERNSKENERKVRDFEAKIKRITEENEVIMKEMKEMHGHKAFLLENRVLQLQENNERLSKQTKFDEIYKRENDEKIKRNFIEKPIEKEMTLNQLNQINKNFNQFAEKPLERKIIPTKSFNPFTKETQNYQTYRQEINKETQNYQEINKESQNSRPETQNYRSETQNYRQETQPFIKETLQNYHQSIEKIHEIHKEKILPFQLENQEKTLQFNKTEIFLKKEAIKEDDIFQETSNLKNDVFEALTSYQKLLSAIQVKKTGPQNLKKYIGDNLQSTFLNYSKILFIYFKPNETFINLLNLNLYVEKPEIIRKKIFSKSQYLSFKDIYLKTNGPKEKEINEMMRNCNEFILEFYEFIRRRPEKQIIRNAKGFAKENKLSELYCGHCNGIFPLEIYKAHISTCDLYRGGRVYEEDIMNKTISFCDKNQRNSLLKLSEMMSLRINYLNDSEMKQRVMNLVINLRGSINQNNKDHLKIEAKCILKDINSAYFVLLLNRMVGLLENAEREPSGIMAVNNHIDNVLSD